MVAARKTTVARGGMGRGRKLAEGEVTIDEAAAEAAVHKGMVSAAKLLLRNGRPDLIAAVDEGRLSLYSALKMEGAGQERQPLGHVGPRRPRTRPVSELMPRALDQLQVSIRLIAGWMSDDQWMPTLVRARRDLANIIRRHRKRGSHVTGV
jgi:hypothetical protein